MRALIVAVMVATAAPNAHAIVGGTPSTDPSVVALVRGEGAATELVCTGTLIASYAVLTAAHCLAGDRPEILVDGERIRPVATFVAPGFDATTLTNDIAIAIFDRTVSPARKPLSPTMPPIGATMDLVGFGRTAPDDTTPFTQRTGTATIAESATTGIVSHGPAFTCEGDSGGPALIDGVIVGVTSSGDDACAEHSRHTRIWDHLDFIEQVITSTRPNTADVGARCWYEANCYQSECLPALDEPRLSFCTTDCADGCPGDLACIDDRCRHTAPSPGALGSHCAIDEDCIDELCVSLDGVDNPQCAQRCFTDLPGFDCPSNATCAAASDGGEACFLQRPFDGCCSGSPAPSFALALLVLGQLLRGRGKP